MDIRKYISLLVVTIFVLVAFYGPTVEACSCMPAHPQTHFCEADYVALIRVIRKSKRLLANKVVYKIEIKRAHKMSAEGHKMLRHGRIVTSDSSASCGVRLEIGKLYTIAGKAPHFNMCSYVKEYTKMSVVERRGFMGIYSAGCKCQVKPCFHKQCLEQLESRFDCKWPILGNCESDFSACMPTSHRTLTSSIAKCSWRRTPAYRTCVGEP